MSKIKQLLISIIGAALVVSLAFFKGFSNGKEKVKYENLEDEVDGFEQDRKIDRAVDDMPISTLRNIMRLFERKKKR